MIVVLISKRFELMSAEIVVVLRAVDVNLAVDVITEDRTATWLFFFFSSRRRHTRFDCDWSSDVCSSDLFQVGTGDADLHPDRGHEEHRVPAVAPGRGVAALPPDHPPGGTHLGLRSEIGRASCRERV